MSINGDVLDLVCCLARLKLFRNVNEQLFGDE